MEPVQTPNKPGGTSELEKPLGTIDLTYFSGVAERNPELAGQDPLVIRNRVFQDKEFRQKIAYKEYEGFKNSSAFDKAAYEKLSEEERKAKDSEGFQTFESDLYERAVKSSYTGQTITEAFTRRRKERDSKNTNESDIGYLSRAASLVEKFPDRYQSFGLTDGKKVTTTFDERGLLALNARRLSDNSLAQQLENDMFVEFQNELGKSHNTNASSMTTDDIIELYGIYTEGGSSALTNYMNVIESEKKKAAVKSGKGEALKPSDAIMGEYARRDLQKSGVMGKVSTLLEGLKFDELKRDPTSDIVFEQKTMNYNRFTDPAFEAVKVGQGTKFIEMDAATGFANIVKHHLKDEFDDEAIYDAYVAMSTGTQSLSKPYRNIREKLYQKALKQDGFTLQDLEGAFKVESNYKEREEETDRGFFYNVFSKMPQHSPAVGFGAPSATQGEPPKTTKVRTFDIPADRQSDIAKLALDVVRSDNFINQSVGFDADSRRLYYREYEDYRKKQTIDNVDKAMYLNSLFMREERVYNEETGEFEIKRVANNDGMRAVWNGIADGIYHLPSTTIPFTLDLLSRPVQLVDKMRGMSWDEVDANYNKFRDQYYNPYVEEGQEYSHARFISSFIPSMALLPGPMKLWATVPKAIAAKSFISAATYLTEAGANVRRAVTLGRLGKYAPNLARFQHLKRVGEAIEKTGAYGLNFTLGSATNAMYIGAVNERSMSVIGNGFMDFAAEKAGLETDLASKYRATGMMGRVFMDMTTDLTLGVMFDSIMSAAKIGAYGPLKLAGKMGEGVFTNIYGRYTGDMVQASKFWENGKMTLEGKPILAPDFVNMFTKTGVLDVFDPKAGLLTPEQFIRSTQRSFSSQAKEKLHNYDKYAEDNTKFEQTQPGTVESREFELDGKKVRELSRVNSEGVRQIRYVDETGEPVLVPVEKTGLVGKEGLEGVTGVHTIYDDGSPSGVMTLGRTADMAEGEPARRIDVWRRTKEEILRDSMDELNDLLGGDFTGDLNRVLREYDKSAGAPPKTDAEYEQQAEQLYNAWVDNTAKTIYDTFGKTKSTDPEAMVYGNEMMFRIVDTLRTWREKTGTIAVDTVTGQATQFLSHADAIRVAGQDPAARTIRFVRLDENGRALYSVYEMKGGDWAEHLSDAIEKKALAGHTPEKMIAEYMAKNPNASMAEIDEWVAQNVTPIGRQMQFIDPTDYSRKVGRVVSKNNDGSFNALDEVSGDVIRNVRFELDPNRPGLPVLVRQEPGAGAMVPYRGKPVGPDPTYRMPAEFGGKEVRAQAYDANGKPIPVGGAPRVKEARKVVKKGNKKYIYVANKDGDLELTFTLTTRRKNGKTTQTLERVKTDTPIDDAAEAKRRYEAEQAAVKEVVNSKELEGENPADTQWFYGGGALVRPLTESERKTGFIPPRKEPPAPLQLPQTASTRAQYGGELVRYNPVEDRIAAAKTKLSQHDLGIKRMNNKDLSATRKELAEAKAEKEMLLRNETPEVRQARLSTAEQLSKQVYELLQQPTLDEEAIASAARQMFDLSEDTIPVQRNGKTVWVERNTDSINELLGTTDATSERMIRLATERAELSRKAAPKDEATQRKIDELKSELAAAEKNGEQDEMVRVYLREQIRELEGTDSVDLKTPFDKEIGGIQKELDKKMARRKEMLSKGVGAGIPQLDEAITRLQGKLKELKAKRVDYIDSVDTRVAEIDDELAAIARVRGAVMDAAGVGEGAQLQSVLDMLKLRDSVARRITRAADYVERQLGMKLSAVREQVDFLVNRGSRKISELPPGPITNLLRERTWVNQREAARSLIAQTGLDNVDLLYATDKKGRRVFAANNENVPFTVYDPTKSVRKGVVVLMPEPGGTVGMYMANAQLPAGTAPKSQFIVTSADTVIRDPNWVRVGVNQMVEGGKLLKFAPVEIAPGEFVFRRVDNDDWVDTVHLNVQRPIKVGGMSDITDAAYREAVQGNKGDGFVFFNERGETIVVPISHEQAFDERTLMNPTLTEYKRMSAQQLDRTEVASDARLPYQQEGKPPVAGPEMKPVDTARQTSLFDEPGVPAAVVDEIAEQVSKQMPLASRRDVIRTLAGMGLLGGVAAASNDSEDGVAQASLPFMFLALAGPASLSKGLNTKMREVFTRVSNPSKGYFKRVAAVMTGFDKRQKLQDVTAGLYGHLGTPSVNTTTYIQQHGIGRGDWRERMKRTISRITTTDASYFSNLIPRSQTMANTLKTFSDIAAAPEMWLSDLRNSFNSETGVDIFEFTAKAGPEAIQQLMDTEVSFAGQQVKLRELMDKMLGTGDALSPDLKGDTKFGWFGSETPTSTTPEFGRKMLAWYTVYKLEGTNNKAVEKMLAERPQLQALFDAMDDAKLTRSMELNGKVQDVEYNPFTALTSSLKNSFDGMADDYAKATYGVMSDSLKNLIRENQEVAGIMKSFLNFSGTEKEFIKGLNVVDRMIYHDAKTGKLGSEVQNQMTRMLDAFNAWGKFSANRKVGYYPGRVWMDGIEAYADSIRQNLIKDPTLAGQYSGMDTEAAVNAILANWIAKVNGVDVFSRSGSGKIKTGYLRNFNPDSQEFEDAYFNTSRAAVDQLDMFKRNMTPKDEQAALQHAASKWAKETGQRASDFDWSKMVEPETQFYVDKAGNIKDKVVYRLRMDYIDDLQEVYDQVVRYQFEHAVRTLRGQVRSRPSNHLERMRTWDLPLELMDPDIERVIRGYAFDAAPRIARANAGIWDSSDFNKNYLNPIRQELAAAQTNPEMINEATSRVEAMYYTIHGLDPKIESTITDPAAREAAYQRKMAIANIVGGVKRFMGLPHLAFRWAVMDTFTMPLLSPYYHGNEIASQMFKSMWGRDASTDELRRMVGYLGMVRNDLSSVVSGLDDHLTNDTVGLAGKFNRWVKQASDTIANASIRKATGKVLGMPQSSRLDRNLYANLIPIFNSFMDIQSANTISFAISSSLKWKQLDELLGELDKAGGYIENLQTGGVGYKGRPYNEAMLLNEIRGLGFSHVKDIDEAREMFAAVRKHQEMVENYAHRGPQVVYSQMYRDLANVYPNKKEVAQAVRGYRIHQELLLKSKEILHGTNPMYMTPLAKGQTGAGQLGSLATQYTQFVTNVGYQGVQQRMRVPMRNFREKYPDYGNISVAEMLFAAGSNNPIKALTELGIRPQDAEDVLRDMPIQAYYQALRVPQMVGTSLAMYITRDMLEDMLAYPFAEYGEEWHELRREQILNPFAEKDEQITWGQFFEDPTMLAFLESVVPRIGYEVGRSGAAGAYGSLFFDIPNYADTPGDIIPAMQFMNELWQVGRTGMKVFSDPDDIDKMPKAVSDLVINRLPITGFTNTYKKMAREAMRNQLAGTSKPSNGPLNPKYKGKPAPEGPAMSPPPLTPF